MERLILCGGGHVSLEVAHIARRLEFELVVIDDRPEFASRERFPMADQVVCAPFPEALDAWAAGESDYYVILTRGHAHDRDCLEHVLRGKYAYAGMIGSRNQGGGGEGRPGGGGHCPGNPGRGAQPHRPAHRGPDPGGDRRVHRRRAGAGAGPPGPRSYSPAAGEPGVLCTITAKRGSAPGRGYLDAGAAGRHGAGHHRRRRGGAPGRPGGKGPVGAWGRPGAETL